MSFWNRTAKGEEKISVLLSYYLDGSFATLFEEMGFKTLWAGSPDRLENLARSNHVDIAIEWQHGEDDYPVRDLLKKIQKDVRVFLALNWSGKLPVGFDALGYAGSLTVPFTDSEMAPKFFKALPRKRKKLIRKMPLWKDAKGGDRKRHQ